MPDIPFGINKSLRPTQGVSSRLAPSMRRWLRIVSASLIIASFSAAQEGVHLRCPADHPNRASMVRAQSPPERSDAAAVAPASEQARQKSMVWIPPGKFWMGCSGCEMPDAKPVHQVSMSGFWMDATPVTNAQFARFVRATGYKTVAERKPSAKDFPDALPSQLVPGSIVFSPPNHDESLDDYTAWWRWVPGANWRHPEGLKSSIVGRQSHPVVQIAYEDALAYARWAGKTLPTEAEYEYAARGGLDRNLYAWGNDMQPNGKWVGNTFQGHFPAHDTGDDGYIGTSPVTAFPKNGNGLYDMGGNVWQWCLDWYRADYYQTLASRHEVSDPVGPSESSDPQEPGVPKRVVRGGSFLCTAQYCARFLVGSRGKSEASSAASNLGFRCVSHVREAGSHTAARATGSKRGKQS